MTVALSHTDTLQHIQYQNADLKLDDSHALYNKVSSPNGRIVIVGGFGCSLVLNYSFGATNLHVDVTLETPVGSVRIANADLDPSNPTIKIGGSIGPFKAEVNVNFNFSTMVLSASGEICAPLMGCKKGSISIHV